MCIRDRLRDGAKECSNEFLNVDLLKLEEELLLESLLTTSSIFDEATKLLLRLPWLEVVRERSYAGAGSSGYGFDRGIKLFDGILLNGSSPMDIDLVIGDEGEEVASSKEGNGSTELFSSSLLMEIPFLSKSGVLNEISVSTVEKTPSRSSYLGLSLIHI